MFYKTVSCLYREEEDKGGSRIRCECGKERVKIKREETESSKEGVM
jgi:hypothetical protein